ncbi:MAG: MarR family transcriptional regulator [Saccharospirillum sp.]|nr:MarR family transcriptional regulator [Saccharospirillum sp.]
MTVFNSREQELASYLPASPDFKPGLSPFYWVARLSAKYSARMDAILKPLGLNSAKWRVLMIVHEYQQISMSDIATHVVAKLSTITKTVYRMQDDGLLQTRPSAQDARVTEVYLTDLGVQKLAEARQAATRLISSALDDLSDQEVAVFTRTLDKVFHNLT